MAASLAGEQYFTLPDGRTLAYEHNGNPQSSTVVMFFHGVMGVGDAKRMPPGLDGRDVHFIAPTLPGWGKSSPRPAATPLHLTLPQDYTAFLLHLHPNALKDDTFHLYIGGGSYGTVPAQILLGCAHDLFPFNRPDKLKGCLLAAGFCPFYKNPNWAKDMTMANWIGIGPVAVKTPFKLVPRLVAFALNSKVNTPEKAQQFIKGFMFDKMKEDEIHALEKSHPGKTVHELRLDFGNNVYRSIEVSWAGYMDVAETTNANWGLREDLFKAEDEEDAAEDKTRTRILVATTTEDDMAPPALSEWNAKHYRNAHLQVYPGGHIGLMGYFKELWEALLDGA